MEYLTMNNKVKIPKIGFGTYTFKNNEDGEKIVLSAINAGYRLIDTAQNYGTEEIVGRAFKKSGVARDEMFITTKLWFRNFEKEDAEKALNVSLKKLQVDYIDMVLLHWPFGNVYEAWRTLERFYEAGKIRAIGVSNFESDQIVDLVNFNKIRPCLNQIETHLFCQRKEERKWLDKYGVIHQSYSPFASGATQKLFENEIVKKIAINHRKTPSQVALRFLVQKDISVVPKSAHEERIKQNIDIFDFSLSDDEMTALATLDKAEPIIGGRAEKPEQVEYAMTWCPDYAIE